jgi:hypothetical protein
VHGVVDEQGYNDSTQNNHPIGNLNASYNCFPLKPFHDFHPRLGRASVDGLLVLLFGQDFLIQFELLY